MDLTAAAIQFPLRHPAVVGVLVGCRSTGEVAANPSGFVEVFPDGVRAAFEGVTSLDRTGPIPHGSRQIRGYELPGFADLEFVPDPEARWAVTLQVDSADPGRGFRVEHPSGDGDPLAAPPLRPTSVVLDSFDTSTAVARSARELPFLPFGATTLRKTCLPWVDRGRRPLIALATWTW